MRRVARSRLYLRTPLLLLPLVTVLAACGASGSAGSASSSLTAYSSGAWVEQHLQLSPTPRMKAVMATDPATGTVVLFGGQNDARNPTSSGLGDTWVWNGATWTEAHPAVSPSPRWDATMAYDPKARTLVLFGGQSFRRIYGDTWTWDGTTWTEQHPLTSPSPRIRAAM